MKLLPTIIIAGAGLYLLDKVMTATAIPRLNFIVTEVKFRTQGITPIIDLNLQVQNPSNSSITISALTANVSLNGQYIGNVNYFGQTIVPAANQAQLPLTIYISPTGIIQDIVSIVTGESGIHAVFTIAGTANVENLVVPLNVTYTAL